EGFIIVGVTDTGSGIRPEDIEKLGTPFYTTKSEGTGLGLSITYSIVKDHGGRIEVDSEPGRGTTFKVYLPL
ncbi:MAG: ATP-binding protein, partial [Desulfocucumaceae bacterium]